MAGNGTYYMDFFGNDIGLILEKQKAQLFIYIDSQNQQLSIETQRNKQQPNGTIKIPFKNTMKLSIYI